MTTALRPERAGRHLTLIGWAKTAKAHQFDLAFVPAVPTIGAVVGTAGHRHAPRRRPGRLRPPYTYV
jgi:hypothetical protein